MNAMRMLKTTAAICVSIVQEVTIVSVQMDSKCEITKLPWQPSVRLSVKMATKF